MRGVDIGDTGRRDGTGLVSVRWLDGGRVPDSIMGVRVRGGTMLMNVAERDPDLLGFVCTLE